jgi:hypothetical protein
MAEKSGSGPGVRFAATDLSRRPLEGPENGRTDVAFRRRPDRCRRDRLFSGLPDNFDTFELPGLGLSKLARQGDQRLNVAPRTDRREQHAQ